MAKKKITKLTDEQYYEYIMSLKEDNSENEKQPSKTAQPNGDDKTEE